MKVQIKIERTSDCVHVYRDGKLRGSVFRRRVDGKSIWVVQPADCSMTFDRPGVGDYAERRDTWTLRGAILRVARFSPHVGDHAYRSGEVLYRVQVNGKWYYVRPDSGAVFVDFRPTTQEGQAIARRAAVLADAIARRDAQAGAVITTTDTRARRNSNGSCSAHPDASPDE